MSVHDDYWATATFLEDVEKREYHVEGGGSADEELQFECKFHLEFEWEWEFAIHVVLEVCHRVAKHWWW